MQCQVVAENYFTAISSSSSSLILHVSIWLNQRATDGGPARGIIMVSKYIAPHGEINPLVGFAISPCVRKFGLHDLCAISALHASDSFFIIVIIHTKNHFVYIK